MKGRVNAFMASFARKSILEALGLVRQEHVIRLERRITFPIIILEL